MTMKAERQQKEVTSRVIQPSKGGGGHIVDNRDQKFFNSIPQNKMNQSSKVIQGKIRDLGEMELSKATPSKIGMEETWYATLWNALNESDKIVNVANTMGQSSYDSSTNTLYFRKKIVSDLLDIKYEADVKVSHIATITHEMSHAHDHLIKERTVVGGKSMNVDDSTKIVLETEFRAWAREALSAYEAGKKLHNMDDEKNKLIEGWKTYNFSMLDDIKASKAENHMVARMYTYVSKGIHPADVSEISQWVSDNKEFINGRIISLQTSLAKFW